MTKLLNKSKKMLAGTTALSLMAANALMLSPVHAAGVTMTINPSAIAVSVDANGTVSFTTETAYANADVVTYAYPASYDDTSLVGGDVVFSSNDADFTSGSCVANTTANTLTCTVTASGAIDAGSAFSLLFSDGTLDTPATPGSYTWSMTSSKGEYSSVLQYVGEDNVVNVTAIVPSTLSFNIRTLDDASDTNVCDLGVVTTTTTAPNADSVDNGAGECGYALAIGTNSESGFTSQISSDAQLNNATNTIADVAEATTFSAGSEAYGIANVEGASSLRGGGSVNENTFGDSTSAVPQAGTLFVSATTAIDYEQGVDATDTTRVMHGLTVATGTPSGAYDQEVTYVVTANF